MLVRLLLLSLYISISGINIFAQWESIGPYGGYIQCLAKDNQGRILAGTAFGGIFRTSDAGKNWEQIFYGYRNEDVRSLIVNSSGHLFAGTDSRGLYRSTDDGVTWERIINAVSSRTIISLLITPGGDIFAGTFDGLYRSTDNGAAFSLSGNGINGSSIRSLGFSNGYLFAGSDFNGIFRSSTNGDNWEPVNNGIEFNNRLVEAFSSSEIRASFMYTSLGDKAYRTADAGLNWDELNISPHHISDLLIKSNGDVAATTINGGVIKSSNSGDSWESYNLPSFPFSSIEEDDNANLIAGSYGPGTYVTLDDENWNIEVTKMPATLLTSLNYKRGVPGGVITVATRQSGAFASEDEGETFEKVSEDLPYGTIFDFKINPVTNTAYLAHQNGTFKTTYGDWDNWTDVEFPSTHIAFNSLGNTFLFYGSFVRKYTDDINYEDYNIGAVSYSRQAAFDDNDGIYIATANDFGFSGQGVWYSSNSGANWNSINTGLPLNITAVASLDITGFGGTECQKNIIAGSSDGRTFTLNDDFTWNELNPGFSLTPLIRNISTLNYGTGFRTRVVTEKEIRTYNETGCVFNPLTVNEDLQYQGYIMSLLSPNDNSGETILEFVGTIGSGVYKRESTLAADDNIQGIPVSYSLEQNYPNPFNPVTKIQYSIPGITLSEAEGSFVTLKVYDILGNEVAVLLNEERSAGTYEVTFDGSSLSSGVYFYKLTSGSFSDTKKLILIK